MKTFLNLFLILSQNNNMSKKIAFYIMILIVGGTTLSCVFPYPVFQNKANISLSDSEKINNYNESELFVNESNGKISVAKLNWFDSVNSLFPTYTKTRVIDATTLKTYYVYRIGGTNHADVEPIDTENTKIFHQLYGNEYSWARRPVWVEIDDGIWVAGSINGYPHGESYISNNNMEGHTCIHFYQSKTHGTKKVDESHQDCVNKAYKNKTKLAEALKKE